MNVIPAVAGNKPSITTAEFIRVTVYNDANNPSDISIYTFSSAYQFETIDTGDGPQVYSPMGGLLGVGVQQRDLSVTSASTSISVSGIGPENIYLVLGEKIKGSKLEIIRGFYDDNQVLASTSHRYTGIITSYNIAEERIEQTDNFTVTLNASSYKLVLQNKTSGRRTNQASWQLYNPTDTSMDFVSSLTGRTFDFGVAPNPNLKPASSGAGSGTAGTTWVSPKER